jgi:hypothetical protein
MLTDPRDKQRSSIILAPVEEPSWARMDESEVFHSRRLKVVSGLVFVVFVVGMCAMGMDFWVLVAAVAWPVLLL